MSAPMDLAGNGLDGQNMGSDQRVHLNVDLHHADFLSSDLTVRNNISYARKRASSRNWIFAEAKREPSKSWFRRWMVD